VGRLAGTDSQAARRRALNHLFARATGDEQQFLVRLILGDLRQGALEGVMLDALARGLDLPTADVRRAAMLRGDLGAVAATALAQGPAGLSAFCLEVGRPVLPMLAQSADSIDAALERAGPAAVEWKLDGARVQVHVRGQDVAVFTRSLDDITDRVPEVVETARRLDLDQAVFDGEVIALHQDGRPYPFQVSASRFGSRLEVPRLRASLPLTTFVFDVLHLDGADLLDRPASDRHAALSEVVPAEMRVPRLVTSDPTEASQFMQDTLARGHEGVMVKALASTYEAGRRGTGWIKVKPRHTLDLVILAAEWGHGRRRGWLSNLHLGARDQTSGEFVMLGKTFKGLTDEMLTWQTQRLLELERSRDAWTVYVRPELVAEIAFDGIQRSPRYPGGVTLRFARVLGYRTDKSASDADTLESVLALGPDA
jgi:DNA ligase-1